MFNLIFLYMEPCFCHLINKVAVLQKKSEPQDMNRVARFKLRIAVFPHNSEFVL